MNPVETILNKQGYVMLDGGLATELERHGADLDHELWSAKMLLDAPELLRKVHLDFLQAGADIIATATYQASFGGFERAGYDHARAASLMCLSVDIALLAREIFWSGQHSEHNRLRPLVAASIGPYGACLHDGSEYHGNYRLSRQELIAFHRPRMEVLAATDADLFAFETIPSLLEAEALLELMADFPGHSALLSYSCRDGQHVSHGERFSECAALADSSPQIVGVGVNCTDPRLVSSLLETAAAVQTPLLAYPNSGEQWQAENNRWSGEICSEMPVADWYDLGARFFGGCCRTRIGEIRRMRERLNDKISGTIGVALEHSG